MLSVLIVDDEWIEREGIKLLLDESPYEFNVFMAQNGEEALECLHRQHIDLLFTDIKMPFMDGTQLLLQLREMQWLKIAVFSAFADFSYAKTALENRACYYFLKPVNPDEFREGLDKMVDGISRERGELLPDRMSAFLRGEEAAPSELDERIAFLGGACRPCLYDMQEEKETAVAAFCEALEERAGTETFMMMVCGEWYLELKKPDDDMGQEEILGLFQRYGFRRSCAVIGRTVEGTEELRQEFGRMKERLDYRFFGEGNQVFRSEAEEEEKAERQYERIAGEIIGGIENGDTALVRDRLEMLCENLRRNRQDSQIYVKYLYANILKKFSETRNSRSVDFKEILEQVFGENSLTGLHRIMMEMVSRLETEESGLGREQKLVISSVCEIVEKRYHEDISLQSIAEEVYLTPSYLGHLFKRQMGIGLTRYITLTRLEHAKKLLVESNMKMVEIAERVGYQNGSYFNIVFKNSMGISPGQYRQRNTDVGIHAARNERDA